MMGSIILSIENMLLKAQLECIKKSLPPKPLTPEEHKALLIEMLYDSSY